MARFVEWRVGEGADVIVALDPDGGVSQVIAPDVDVLQAFLKVTSDWQLWQGWTGWREAGGKRDPAAWGVPALRRTEAGDVDFVDPEVFWEGVRRWFRSRGEDFTP